MLTETQRYPSSEQGKEKTDNRKEEIERIRERFPKIKKELEKPIRERSGTCYIFESQPEELIDLLNELICYISTLQSAKLIDIELFSFSIFGTSNNYFINRILREPTREEKHRFKQLSQLKVKDKDGNQINFIDLIQKSFTALNHYKSQIISHLFQRYARKSSDLLSSLSSIRAIPEIQVLKNYLIARIRQKRQQNEDFRSRLSREQIKMLKKTEELQKGIRFIHPVSLTDRIIEAVAEFWAIIIYEAYSILHQNMINVPFEEFFYSGNRAVGMENNTLYQILSLFIGSELNIINFARAFQHAINNPSETHSKDKQTVNYVIITSMLQFLRAQIPVHFTESQKEVSTLEVVSVCPVSNILREYGDLLIAIYNSTNH